MWTWTYHLMSVLCLLLHKVGTDQAHPPRLLGGLNETADIKGVPAHERDSAYSPSLSAFFL